MGLDDPLLARPKFVRTFFLLRAPFGQYGPVAASQVCSHERRLFFFLRLPTGQYGPVSQLSRSEERCTGPFNWGEAHCAGEKVKRKIGPFQWKSL